jgi:hypothetical protein
MRFDERLSASFAALICLSLATSVMAQDLAPSTTRGTIKVQSRLFNPFDVSGSRLSMDPFGFFTLQQGAKSPSVPSPLLTSPAAETSLTSTAGATATSSDSTAAPAGNLATSSAVLNPTTVIAVGAARPPFRPPVRSPFRPPPRPPF